MGVSSLITVSGSPIGFTMPETLRVPSMNFGSK